MARKQANIDRNWFKRVRREFSRAAMPFAGKPIVYVEIGVWRGGSADWVCKNVLTHAESQGYFIDPYLPGHRYDQTLADNVFAETKERIEQYQGCKVIREKSQVAMRDWNGRPGIDLLYIDGSHTAMDVLMDFCFAWPHLKNGSRVIFDDFGIGMRKRLSLMQPQVPDAVAAIFFAFSPFVRISHGNLQAQVDVIGKPALGEIAAPKLKSHAMPEIPSMI